MERKTCGAFVPRVASLRSLRVSDPFTKKDILYRFWKARGATDETLREALVRSWEESQEEEGSVGTSEVLSTRFVLEVDPTTLLPGVKKHPSFLTKDESIEASERLLQLHGLLGGGSIDVVWMVIREPLLLSIGSKRIARRLVSMSSVCGKDILPLIEKHPGLLLEDGMNEIDGMDPRDLLEAWKHGVVLDSKEEWYARYRSLMEYKEEHGDCSVGSRDGDDRSLLRWTRKQRKDKQNHVLDPEQASLLERMGFLWDEECAEWEAWYTHLVRYHRDNGDVDVKPYGSSEDSALRHWLSVQRVARRTGRLSGERFVRLDALGVDWEGVDPIHA